jgi:hypothetical protein
MQKMDKGYVRKWTLAKTWQQQLRKDGRRQGRQKVRKAKKTWEETGHQESNLKLHSNGECSCTSAPRRSPIDEFIANKSGHYYNFIIDSALPPLRVDLRKLAVHIDLVHRPARYLDMVVCTDRG